MTPLLIFVATLFVAYANGANDNFKGVATLLAFPVSTTHGLTAAAAGRGRTR